MEIRFKAVLIMLLIPTCVYGASSGEDLPKDFTLSVLNNSLDSIEFLAHNTEPLSDVPGQELSKYTLNSKEERDVELDSPFFVVRSNRNVYYALIELEDKFVNLAQQAALKLTLKPLGARMVMAIDNYSNPKKPQKLHMQFINLKESPKDFDVVEDELLQKSGINREIKHQVARQFLRASM